MEGNMKTNKSNNNCCVPQCCSTYKTPNVSLHRFPVYNKQLSDKWAIILKIGKKVSPYMKVCSLHFENSDYFFNKEYKSLKPKLKKNVVPSKNLLPRTTDLIINEEANKIRKTGLEARNQRKVEMKAAKESISPMEIMQDLLNSETLNAAENLLYFKEHPCNDLTVFKTTEDKSVQVNTFDDFKIWRIDTFIDINNKCNVLTSIVNIKHFKVLIKKKVI
ncbi:hypothetical protein ILUMI_05578 [Ignelater luminosus]|uniref:THAP-type domain-containing protein n=1 Tax=Ignelater luminosus TaxID=2038154 RepID=A0A8K0D7F9_IGNLU|nr:hypothetical protein ILUMI_05578 [Ignelater luminosus]